MLPQDTVTPSEVPVELPVEIVFQILEWGVRVSHKFSLSASLVCKETRRLALPHVFKTLFIRDADRVISNHHFLPYPSLVQNIWFDPPTQDENMRSDPKTPFPPSSGRLNITHLAVCNTASLAAIDCDPTLHEAWALSNLDLCQSLTFFNIGPYPNLILSSGSVFRFLADNITHLQLFLSSDHQRGHTTMAELLSSCTALTHLAVTAPELVGTNHAPARVLDSYWFMLIFTKGRILRRSAGTRWELVVLMVDWHQWARNDGQHAWTNLMELARVARGYNDGQTSMAIVPWNMSVEGQVETLDATSAIRNFWRKQVSGRETVWDRALRPLEELPRSVHI